MQIAQSDFFLIKNIEPQFGVDTGGMVLIL